VKGLRSGSASDADRAVELARKSIELTPAGHAHLSSGPNDLGNILLDLYLRFCRRRDLLEAVDAYREAVHATSNTSPRLASRLANLASSLQELYRLDPSDRLLDELQEVHRDACEIGLITSPGDALRSSDRWGR
jgi:tetratricopeptide (TPR) repeat protein